MDGFIPLTYVSLLGYAMDIIDIYTEGMDVSLL